MYNHAQDGLRGKVRYPSVTNIQSVSLENWLHVDVASTYL